MSVVNNSTHEDDVVDPAANARFPAMISIYIPVFLVSEIGNGFVLKRRQRTAIDSFILNLAIADFLITTMSLFNAIEYMKNEWPLGEAMCKIHGQMVEVCYTVSMFTLLAISYNRRKVLNDPFKTLNARKELKRNIALIWLAAIIVASPLAYAYTVANRNDRFHCSNTNIDKTSRSICYLLQAVILFLLPVTIRIVSQWKITNGLRQHYQLYMETMEDQKSHFKRVMGHERKVSKFLTWIWIVFFCCFTPHVTLRTVDDFISIRRNEIWNQIWHVSQLVALLNSAINPFLYYRTTNRELFCWIRQENNCEVASSNHRSHVMTDLICKKRTRTSPFS